MEPISDVSVQRNAVIENLPAELRHAILEALDCQSLWAMARASPAFYQQYHQDRGLLLSKCLERTLGAATIDACAVYRSNPERLTDKRTMESDTEFLELYRNRLSSAAYSVPDEGLSDKELEALLAFHLTVVEPLVQRFADWALGNFAEKAGGSPHHVPLSRTEEARIVRALYRFQLCCHLFREQTSHLQGLGMCDLVFPLFEPWEVEQVVCVHAFVKDQFDRLFHALDWEAARTGSRFDDTPTDGFKFYDDDERESWLSGTVLSGLGVLRTVLFKMRDHEDLATTMDRALMEGDDFEISLWHFTQEGRRDEHPSERDRKEEAGEPLPFMGDLEPDLHGSCRCPPLAWTLACKGVYSNWYGDYLGDEMRLWGYVMWDAARLEVGGGEGLISRQWTGRDPQTMI